MILFHCLRGKIIGGTQTHRRDYHRRGSKLITIKAQTLENSKKIYFRQNGTKSPSSLIALCPNPRFWICILQSIQTLAPERTAFWRMEKGLISVDRWSDHSQVYFLTHLHSDHTQCLSSSWTKGPLFCSRLTAKLFPFKFPNFNLSLLRILEIGSWHSVSLVSPSSGSETTVDVMAIDAHHCPGPSVVWI